ncbi:hypothetical protein [Pseudomonas costantinii]|nr:hypothetical protein [Pseudomonas costantinii]NVZ72007.1 hypothetical protein [Pseudomonas costantinii]
MNQAKPIDPQELVKWLVALSRAIHPDRSHALRGNDHFKAAIKNADAI